MSNYLIDTNIITAILKNNTDVITKIHDAIINGEEVLINGISYYEVKRGLLAVNATTKLSLFEKFCNELGTIWLDEQNIFDEAALIYSNLKKVGKLIEDADILIAAIAKTRDLILVSGDSAFQRVSKLKIENWL